ncbi:glycosyltransferase family 2 protein [Vibrio caribbeanicus]|uniref:glycosyltransferase family 2 protein n=1 Tax=Vibrio caribbeanicus TaxID=701175 RepID=UPI002284BDD5|nr:glycosyltransferase family 2 protein [Vibrio caribbeanicus]MCY9844250.1 glycosyltransferase family 2 protein [Vibrio caribbeanicus]
MTDNVPKYNVAFDHGKRSEYCVIVFVINEGKKLLKQLSRMRLHCESIDIVVADGGSSDGSTRHDVLSELNVRALLVKQDVGKLGSQMRISFSWALNQGYKGVVVIDGNNKDSVENIPDFVTLLSMGYDHVQGSRFIEGGNAVNTPFSRLLGLKLLHAPLIRLSSGFSYTDTTNGFRAYSANFLRSSEVGLFRKEFKGYELHYYLAISAGKKGFKCIETPVTRTYPKGKVPTKISPIRGNIQVLVKLIECCLGKYDL